MGRQILDQCFKCDTDIWVPERDYMDNRNFCYPCAMSYAGIEPSEYPFPIDNIPLEDEEVNKARTEQAIG